MKTIIIILFSSILLAQNPTAFSSLGDKVYNSVEKIKKLKEVEEYAPYYFKIDKYDSDVNELKKLGYILDESKDPNIRMKYLNNLRELSEINDDFFKMVDLSLESSIKKNDNIMFSRIMNSGLIDIKKNKDKILNYYKLNKDSIVLDADTKTLLDNMTKKIEYKRYDNKAKKEEEKINRLRDNDRFEKEQLEKKLQKELELKKRRILRYKRIQLNN